MAKEGSVGRKNTCKLEEIQDNPEYDDGIREDIRKRIKKYNNELKTRQESIDLLKGRLKDQITSFKETITKVLEKEASLAEKIWMLFREQGIVIASILTAIRMATGVLVEALLPGGGGVKDEKGLKEWIKNKLKALASLSEGLGVKAVAALSGIIGPILSWVLYKSTDVVGWLSQNLWVLVVGIGELLYMYMVTKSKKYITMCLNFHLCQLFSLPMIVLSQSLTLFDFLGVFHSYLLYLFCHFYWQ